MNLIYLFVSTLLLWNSCFAEDSARVGNPQAESELMAWLTTSIERPMFGPVLWGMFRIRYPKYEVQLFTGNVLAFYGRKNRLSVDDAKRTIHIADSGLAMKFIEYFGNAFQRLYISSDFSKVILEKMTHPIKLEALRIDIKHEINIESLYQLFPLVRDLSLKLEADVNYSYLSHAFRWLLSLDVTITKESWKRKKQIDGIFWINHRVKAIAFSGFPADYIKTINRLVPKVEMLTLFGFDTADEIVELNHVKQLNIFGTEGQSGPPGPIENLLCPQLKGLEFFYAPQYYKSWRTFFRNHPNLTSINLREGRLQDYRDFQEGVQIVQLISSQSNLHTFTMHRANLFSNEIVKDFIENHPTLTMFHISHYPRSLNTMVIKMPDGNWKIHVTQNQQLVFIGTYDDYEHIMRQVRADRV